MSSNEHYFTTYFLYYVCGLGGFWVEHNQLNRSRRSCVCTVWQCVSAMDIFNPNAIFMSLFNVILCYLGWGTIYMKWYIQEQAQNHNNEYEVSIMTCWSNPWGEVWYVSLVGSTCTDCLICCFVQWCMFSLIPTHTIICLCDYIYLGLRRTLLDKSAC